MRFGVFYELQLPRPWHDESELDLFRNALDQLEVADRLGYDTAWVVEHHFLEEYSHSSAPEVFLGAASQRTSNIRLGHGIVQLTTNPPARVAERVATLDLLSNGRVELGLGEGNTLTELEPFGRDYRNFPEKREIFEEGVQALISMFGEGSTEFHGKHVDFPSRNVLPKPRQKPHPPLWVACSKLETIRDAGRWGMGALGFQFVSGEAAEAWVNAYYNAFIHEAAHLADYVPNPNLALVSGFMCCETDEEARVNSEGWTFFQFALRYWGANGKLGDESLWQQYEAWRAAPENAGKGGGNLIGSPATLREKLRRFERSHVDEVILLNQAGNNRHDHIVSSLELFAAEVMPEFHERDTEHQAWKSAVLAGDIVLEEIDTSRYTNQWSKDGAGELSRTAAS